LLTNDKFQTEHTTICKTDVVYRLSFIIQNTLPHRTDTLTIEP
jgi:hypothetical protein